MSDLALQDLYQQAADDLFLRGVQLWISRTHGIPRCADYNIHEYLA
jgi:hypothetical protein